MRFPTLAPLLFVLAACPKPAAPTTTTTTTTQAAPSKKLDYEPVPRFYALILGGGKQQADADAVKSAFHSGESLQGGLTPAAGFPKIVKSDDVRGLNPGFYVAVL